MRLAFLLAGAAVMAAAAMADGDIIWPRYVLVTKSYDAELTCPQLKAEIGRVGSDIELLKRAQDKAEESIETIRNMQQVMNRDQSNFSNTKADENSGMPYIQARNEIRESRRIAGLRRDHLTELAPSCKGAATP
jgi:hypothetical protein